MGKQEAEINKLQVHYSPFLSRQFRSFWIGPSLFVYERERAKTDIARLSG